MADFLRFLAHKLKNKDFHTFRKLDSDCNYVLLDHYINVVTFAVNLKKHDQKNATVEYVRYSNSKDCYFDVLYE